MLGLQTLSQINGSTGSSGVTNVDGWWWSTLTSRPAMLLLLLGVGCLVVVVYLAYRLRSISAQQAVGAKRVSLKQRFADDSGVAMIEFVLVTPIIMFLTLLLLQTMLVFTGLFYVQYSAFAAARSAIVYIPAASPDEQRNEIIPQRGSAKFDAIESAAMIAVTPVSGRESGSVLAGTDLVNGVSEIYSAQGKSVPPWVDGMLAERLNYAMNHTRVELEKVTPGESVEAVIFDQVSGLTTFSPKEAIGVRVQHEFALTIPVASKIFAISGRSGTYQPATLDGDAPAAPGQWTLIESRAVLTNEGIDNRLPPEPVVPRR